jgi:hypothetical protein
MKSWGSLLFFLGIGSFILPYMNIQFALVSLFGEGNEMLTGAAFIAVGAVLWFLGKKQEAKTAAGGGE